MSTDKLEVASIIKQHLSSFIQKHDPLKYHIAVLTNIKNCRTAALGGHVDKCDDCGEIHISYNSCRNRHCPKCQGSKREEWIMARQNDLLKTTYFHVVFTIPEQLNKLCLKFPDQMYEILFQASRETLETFGNDKKHLGAKIGMIGILHTWGQNLTLHPHIHYVTPAGGITNQNNWVSAKYKDFLFPVKALSSHFRCLFVEKLRIFLKQNNITYTATFRNSLYLHNWNVYAKQPFMGPSQVVEYLGRYTHKIAISNNRIKNIENGIVTFSYKDYKDNNKTKLMSLKVDDFLQRFCMHILPKKFVKIRHYGLLSSRNKQKLKAIQTEMNVDIVIKTKDEIKKYIKTKYKIGKCSFCKNGNLIRIHTFNANAPPLFLFSNILSENKKKL